MVDPVKPNDASHAASDEPDYTGLAASFSLEHLTDRGISDAPKMPARSQLLDWKSITEQAEVTAQRLSNYGWSQAEANNIALSIEIIRNCLSSLDARWEKLDTTPFRPLPDRFATHAIAGWERTEKALDINRRFVGNVIKIAVTIAHELGHAVRNCNANTLAALYDEEITAYTSQGFDIAAVEQWVDSADIPSGLQRAFKAQLKIELLETNAVKAKFESVRSLVGCYDRCREVSDALARIGRSEKDLDEVLLSIKTFLNANVDPAVDFDFRTTGDLFKLAIGVLRKLRDAGALKEANFLRFKEWTDGWLKKVQRAEAAHRDMISQGNAATE